MRKSTIVVALLAATVASAEAAPNSAMTNRGLQTQTKNDAQPAAIRSTASGQATNGRSVAPVPKSSAAAGVAAFTSARNAAPRPATATAAAAPIPLPKGQASRVAVRFTQAAAARAETRRVASVRRLAKRTRVVALTREIPDDRIAAPASAVVAAAPTGAIPGMVTQAAQRAGVNPALAHAVVKVESRYQPRATGKGGYIGLMQLSYQTARGMGFRGSRQALYEPSANLQYGMRYLAEAVRKSGGDTCSAVSKYQGGHAVRGVTRAGAVYCAKVRRFMASAR